jgi:hypothetical protein
MSGYTPEQLREYPTKDRWTPQESLATIEVIDGTECIHGVPLPFYVATTEDRVRWANCVRVASRVSGDSVPSLMVQQMARTMYVDRETYTD